MIKQNFNKGKRSIRSKAFLLIAMLLVTSLSFGQKSSADAIYEKHAGKDGFTSVYISELMFKLISKMNPEDQEFKNLVNEMTGIKILSMKDKKLYPYFKESIINKIPAKEYEELMIVKEEGNDVKILIREKAGKISELLIITDNLESASLIIIQGSISLQNLGKLSKISGLEQLENIEVDK